MIDFDWENIDPNLSDEEIYKRYVTSTVPVPEPYIVEDPHLPAPSQGTIYSAGTQLESTQRIAATAPIMDEGKEPQRYSNSNHACDIECFFNQAFLLRLHKWTNSLAQAIHQFSELSNANS